MDLEKLNWIKGGKHRGSILLLLNKNPMLPSEIAYALSLSRASVSRTLSELLKKGLIQKAKSNTRTVTYFITNSAKDLIPDISSNKYYQNQVSNS
jgi:DNA-binding MarR family transcriptional regulator